jgi:MFS transporter, DHA3 family, macrolide efflux protein
MKGGVHRMMQLLRHNRKFGKLISSSLISQMGSFFTYMLLIVISYDHNHSMLATMGITGASSIGSLIAGFFSGVVVDRGSPVRIMVTSYMCSALVIASLFWLPANVYCYYAVALLIAVFGAFSSPAFSKYQVMIVERKDLADANASFQVLREIVKIVGPGLAVFVLGLLPSEWKPIGFLIDASSYALAALLFVGRDFQAVRDTNATAELKAPTEKSSFVNVWREGLQPLRNPIVTNVLILYFLIILGIAGADVILTAHVSHSGYSSLYLGYLIAAWSAGLILASLLGPRVFRKWSLAMQLGGSAVGIGVFYAGIGVCDNIYGMLASGFVLGLFNAVYNVSAPTYWQEQIPMEQIGRFFALVSSIFSVLTLVGMSLNGLLGTWYSPRLVLQVSGGAIAMVGFISIFTIMIAERRVRFSQMEKSFENSVQ